MSHPTRRPSAPLPLGKEGRDWRFLLDTGEGTVVREAWGRIKIENGWAMVVDTDDDGVGFIVFASPAESVVSVESI